MTRTTQRSRWTWAVAIILIVVVAVAIAAVLGNRMAPPDRAPQKVDATPENLALGKYLARASDCAACHQTANGQAYAGGFPLKTPFGTIYGSNITPDPDHGIGRWTADDFYQALTQGKSARGANLYPAMPYTAYHGMTREDSDLIYGYLMNLRPSPQADKAPEVPFPLNLRFLMSGWNLLFFDKGTLPSASTGESAQWLRGRYLVNVLGHCAECHTPRGLVGQLKHGEWLKGYALTQYLAPDLTPEGLAKRGWDQNGLEQFMRTGVSPHAVASDEMYPVIVNSTQYLNAADLSAMASYLLGDKAPAAPVPPAAGAVGEALMPGRKIFLNACAGCHGAQGEGMPQTMPPLAGNTSLLLDDPRNLILPILHGLPEQSLPGATVFGEMPAFAAQLSDTEIAQLANYLRSAWGNRPAEVTEQTVQKLREQK